MRRSWSFAFPGNHLARFFYGSTGRVGDEDIRAPKKNVPPVDKVAVKQLAYPPHVAIYEHSLDFPDAVLINQSNQCHPWINNIVDGVAYLLHGTPLTQGTIQEQKTVASSKKTSKKQQKPFGESTVKM